MGSLSGECEIAFGNRKGQRRTAPFDGLQGHPGKYAGPPHPGVAEGAITETEPAAGHRGGDERQEDEGRDARRSSGSRAI